MRIKVIKLRGTRLIAALSILAPGATLAAVPAPRIEVTGNGSYTVSYAPCGQCVSDGLEEFDAAYGTWRFVGTGEATFTNRSPGTYRYRVVYVVIVGRVTPMSVYGPEAAVVVEPASTGELEGPPLSAQFDAEYSISSGDVNGDGRRDLLIRRTKTSSESGDGTLADVLLRQTGTGTFAASIPTSYQAALASSWPEAPVEIRKRDVNIDGYVDLVLRGIGAAGGFGGVSNQILLAPGASDSEVPVLVDVDPALTRFSEDLDRHLIDPDYYPNNSPLNYAVVYYYAWNCGWGYGSLESWLYGPCFIEPMYFYIAYRDYSGFDQDAMTIASIDYNVIKGYESAASGLERIAEVIARVLGVRIGGWDIKQLIGGGTDPESNRAERRGMELFAVLAGISEAAAQEPDEPAEPAAPDRVLLKGRRVLGLGPFHTALEYQYSTVSAFDSDPSVFDGLLISEVDWPRDHPSLTLRMGYVDGPTVPIVYWGAIRAADARYDDDLPYDAFPSLGQGGYNSNSFVSGLILATLGQSTVEMTSFVGGERPVPPGEFN